MIQINLDIHRNNFINVIKKYKNEKIIIYDLRDPVNLYPYTKCKQGEGWDYFYQIFTSLPEEYYDNLHFLSIVFNLKECYDLVKKTCIKEKIISNTHSDFHIHTFPWMFAETMFHNNPETTFSKTINPSKKYKVCMLSLKKKFVRMILLSKFYLHKDFIFSNIGLTDVDEFELIDDTLSLIDDVNFYDKHLNLFYTYDSDIEEFRFKYSLFNVQHTTRLTENFNFLFDFHKSSKNEKFCFDQSILCNYAPLEYFESSIILNCESSCLPSSILTEKTFKNFLFKKPFISMAGPYFNQFLKLNHFELYDELFDYSYDNFNCSDRLGDIILQIHSILNEKINYLEDVINSNDMKNKMQYNYDLSRQFYSMCCKYIVKTKKTPELLNNVCCKKILEFNDEFKPVYFS